MKDMWISLLVLLILTACFTSEHLDVPDKADVVKVSSTPEQVQVQKYEDSSCEIENKSLRIEADEWRDRFINFQCDCESNYDPYN